MSKDDKKEYRFTLKLKSGKTKSFNSGYAMWKWANQNSPGFETKFNEKQGPFLADFFAKLHKINKAKKEKQDTEKICTVMKK